jgi:PAS domain S-box-containing protein
MLNGLSLQYDLEQEKQNLERLVAERTKELNKSEQWHRSLFENATDGVVVLDKSGNIVNINEKASEIHGFAKDALIDVNIELLENDSNRANMAERMRRILDGESLVFETTHNKKDGTPIHLEISSKAIIIGEELFIQSFYRDITEKKKLREHLSQTQKLDSIGVLAGGIAHDFNNILAAIMGHAEVVRVYSPSLEAKSLRSLQVIEDASRKAGGMISKLLGFARKSTYEMVPLNLNDVIHDTVKLLERILDKNISLKMDLDGPLPVIKGDFNQLEQVIMNLMVNARDAMPQGGAIHIRTQSRNIIKGMTDVPPYVLPGEYVLMSVTDTGPGVPLHLVQKIFEPFFTTKERGKGTGLGLSMVYGAVKEHKGYIIVESRPNKGSTFIVYLPVTREALSWAGKEMETFIKGKEAILFVDDEEEVVNAAREVLTTHGYKVTAATDSDLALELFRKAPREIDLVITDMVMPKTDGKEFIRRLRAINPETKILAVSGYMKYVAEKEDIQNINGFLQKPFDSRHLLSTIRRILDARPDASPPLDV